MFKAVFIDMDGTLLRNDHTISSVNKQAIERLLVKNIMVVPVSARPLHGIMPIIQDVIPPTMPIVSLNGSYIFFNNEILFQVAIELPDAVGLHNELQHYDASMMYYSQMEWFSASDDQLVKKEQRITPIKIKIQPFDVTLKEWQAQQAGPNKILIAAPNNIIAIIEDRLLELYGASLNIYKSQPTYLEVMNMEASKPKAIKFLLKKYGFEQQDIIAIGDNYNDKGMIEFAGIGVAMGNAPAEIKDIADYVTDTNMNDGVAKALNHFFP